MLEPFIMEYPGCLWKQISISQKVFIFLQVTTPNEEAALLGHMTTESPYTMVMQASHNSKVMWKTDWTVDTLDRTLKAVTSYNKGNIVRMIP